jgi:hypothetical protein
VLEVSARHPDCHAFFGSRSRSLVSVA